MDDFPAFVVSEADMVEFDFTFCFFFLSMKENVFLIVFVFPFLLFQEGEDTPATSSGTLKRVPRLCNLSEWVKEEVDIP